MPKAPAPPAATDAALDALYGLEPVFEPDALAGTSDPLAWVLVECPYCGESFETTADLSAGSFTHVEDCQVCCQPIEVAATVDADGRLAALVTRRLD